MRLSERNENNTIDISKWGGGNDPFESSGVSRDDVEDAAMATGERFQRTMTTGIFQESAWE